MKQIIVFLLCAIFAATVHASTATAVIGQKVYLSVVADGTQPFTYQWQKGSVAIQGATAATYIIAAATVADAGVYTVTVVNTAGSTVSDTATLNVSILPPSNARTSINVTVAQASTPLDLWQSKTHPMLTRWGVVPLDVAVK